MHICNVKHNTGMENVDTRANTSPGPRCLPRRRYSLPLTLDSLTQTCNPFQSHIGKRLEPASPPAKKKKQ